MAGLLLLSSVPMLPVSAETQKTVLFQDFDRSINGGEPIRGADVSSVISLEESGVKFHNDTDYAEEDIFKILADHGVNYIRVRVWNQPSDEKGNSYGGGHNDVKTAAEIGRRAAKYGMKLLVDFHYSDFWADPEKQRVPKAWQNYSTDEKGSAIYYYTLESLQTIRDAGADIGMVQIGNETNGAMCGESDMYAVCKLMTAGCNAVSDFDSAVLKAVHFADPSSGKYPWYAKTLDECQVNYDVFATSYYPYWHGTTQNLTSVLKQIADTYDKYVMVAETAYPYTSEDGDKFVNVVSEQDASSVFRYEISVEGQTACFTDVFQAVADVGSKGIGAFYWEPAWIGDYNASWTDQKDRWQKHGSGWATSWAAEYDSSVTEAGGSGYDNQALFNFWGYPQESLNVYRNIYPQQYVYQSDEEYLPVPGLYEIKNRNSGYYLSSDADGNVIQSETPQQWHLFRKSGSYALELPSGEFLTIVQDTSDEKNSVRLGSEAQKFHLVQNPDQSCLFMLDNTSCLDIFDGSLWKNAWSSYGKALRSSSQEFVLQCVSEDAAVKGDVFRNWEIDLQDVILFQKYLLKKSSFTQEQAETADINGDGIVNIYDLLLLKRTLFQIK